MRTSSRSRWAGLVVAAAVITLAIAGCAHHTTRAHAATPSSTPRPDRFEVRPVLAITPAPCRADQVPDWSNHCYALGAVALDARHVASATVSFQAGGDGYGIDIVLTADGLRRFNALATRNFGQPMPQNEVALVVDGRVIRAPALQTGHFDAGGVRVGAWLSKDDAQHVADMIG